MEEKEYGLCRWRSRYANLLYDDFLEFGFLESSSRLLTSCFRKRTAGKMVMFRSPLVQSLKSDALLKKTLKLSNKDIIGAGGFGTVYRLTVNDATAFAVKRLHRGTAEVDRGFERELEAMGDIKHRNIVTLHGYYTAPQYNLLIYELMPNGSLDTFLHGMHIQLQKYLQHKLLKLEVKCY